MNRSIVHKAAALLLASGFAAGAAAQETTLRLVSAFA